MLLAKKIQSKLIVNLWSLIWNTDTWWLWIRKVNPLFNSINNQPDINEIYTYAIDPYGAKYKL